MNDRDDELGRDPELARALGDIPVPEYEPGFWDRLETRLQRESTAASPAEVASVFASVSPVVEPQTADDRTPIELTTIVPEAARASRERRRSVGLLAAAAAVVIAVLAARIGEDDPAPLEATSEVDGDPRPGPHDGTTTPDDAERDGAPETETDSDDVEGDGADQGADRTTGEGGAADPADRTLDLFASTSLPRGPTGSGGSTSESSQILSAPATAEETFIAWARAIAEGDADAVVALTGPRSIRYYGALGTSVEKELVDDAAPDGWGVWADPAGRRLQPIELGTVDGERAVGLVVDRPTDDPTDGDGRIYQAIPVVRGKDGWRVEPAAFDPKTDGKIRVISPAEGEDGLQELPKGGVIKVAAKPDGRYVLGLDFSQQVSIPASDAVDGVITWNPGGQRSATVPHLLVVAHIRSGQIVMLAQTFETAPA